MKQITEAVKAMDKAKDAIETAEFTLTGGFVSAAANRAYYAMFYCMTALLLTEGVYAKTHSGTKARFRELFIRNGTFPTIFSEYVEEAFNTRQRADYDMDAIVTEAAVHTLIANAKAIYDGTKNYLLSFMEED